MILNNIERDMKIKFAETDTTQRRLAEKAGVTSQFVNAIVKRNHKLINKSFVKLMHHLGYDIRLEYIKRGEENE